jgi:hypothetical protein
MIAIRIRLPTLEHLKGNLRVSNSLKAHDGVRGVLQDNTTNDPWIETADSLGADGIEQTFDVLVRIRDVLLRGIITKPVDVVDEDPGGGVTFVGVVRGKEVDRRTRVTRNWNLELFLAFGLEERIFESAVALL